MLLMFVSVNMCKQSTQKTDVTQYCKALANVYSTCVVYCKHFQKVFKKQHTIIQ